MHESKNGIMDDEEPLPKKPAGIELRNLEPLSVEELADYIIALEAEIARVAAERERKLVHRSGAESLFRK